MSIMMEQNEDRTKKKSKPEAYQVQSLLVGPEKS